MADYLRIYDAVFEELTKDGNAMAFRDFLLKSPEMFVALGEGTGMRQPYRHFWRFRFPKGGPLEADVGELLDILQDFHQGLGEDDGEAKTARHRGRQCADRSWSTPRPQIGRAPSSRRLARKPAAPSAAWRRGRCSTKGLRRMPSSPAAARASVSA